MRQRTAKEAYCESQNGRELTKFQQWRYNRKLKQAKKIVMKLALGLIDGAVGKGKYEVELDVQYNDVYNETLLLGIEDPVPAIPKFFTQYEKEKLHKEVIEYVTNAFKSFGYKVELTNIKTNYFVSDSQVVGKRVRLEWSGKYGNACGES